MSALIRVGMNTLPDRLRFLRTASGRSARRLCRDAGLKSHVHWTGLELGKRDPCGSTLRKISLLCGVTMDWLYAGVGDEPDPSSIRAAIERASTQQTEAAA